MARIIICNKCGRQTRLVRDEMGEKRSKEENSGEYKAPRFFALCCEHYDCDNHLFDKGFSKQENLVNEIKELNEIVGTFVYLLTEPVKSVNSLYEASKLAEGLRGKNDAVKND